MRRIAPFGRYRRAIRIDTAPGRATAAMEDDVHHLSVALEHAGGSVTAATGAAPRTPWAICPAATGALQALVGMPLDAVGRMAAPERAGQCMHLHDLAMLAAAHAGEAGFHRLYRIEADYDAATPASRLWRDDAEILGWSVAGQHIVGSRFDGVPLAALAGRLADATADEREAALVLRRATLISAVRLMDLDAVAGTDAANPNGPANCFAKQPERRHLALRQVGTSRDFWAEDRWPLASV